MIDQRHTVLKRMSSQLGPVLKVGISAGLLGVMLIRTDVAKIRAALTSVPASAVAAALGVMVLQTVVTTYRWVWIMRGFDVSIRFWPALQARYVSLVFNQCVPSYIGGDAYRVYWLYREGHSPAAAVRGVLIDRISALMALVVMMAVSVPLLFERYPNPATRTGLVVVLAGGVAGMIAFFACAVLPMQWRRFAVVAEAVHLSAATRRLLLTGSAGLLVGPLAILAHLLSAATLFAFACGLQIPFTFVDCILLVPPILLVTALPISIAGWGVREGVIVGALSMVGIATERALALSILFGFAALANSLLGFLPLIFDWQRFVPVRKPS